MCYYCEHGLPPRVQEIFDRFEAEGFEAATAHAAHAVLSDYNLDNDNILRDLRHVANHRGLPPEDESYVTPTELDATERALRDLLAISESERDPASRF